MTLLSIPLFSEARPGISGIDKDNYADPSVQIAAGVRVLFEKYRRSQNWQTAVRDYNGGKHKEAYTRKVLRIYKSHRRK